MEIKRDYDVMNGNNDENIEDVGEMEYLDMEMREYENEENFAVFEECFHNFHSIAYRRNVLANMEMLILRMLIEDGSLTNIEFSIYSKLKILLIDYHQRVKKFLKRNKALVEFKDNSQRKQLIKCFKKKYNQLKQLLLKMTKVWLNYYNFICATTIGANRTL